jgi:hypothetical protein
MRKLIKNINRGNDNSNFGVLTEAKLSSSMRADDVEAAIDTTSPRQTSLGNERARFSTICNPDQQEVLIVLEM